MAFVLKIATLIPGWQYARRPIRRGIILIAYYVPIGVVLEMLG